MRSYLMLSALAIAALPSMASAQPASGPYHVVQTAKVGGEGGWDYVYADAADRLLFIPRSGQGPTGRITIFDLDTLKPVGEIPGHNAHGVAVDPKSHLAFSTSKPVAIWDTRTPSAVRTVDVQGNPDGILFDAFNERVYVWSHSAPNATVFDATNGTVLGTIDLGGAPEQATTDGHGQIYVDLEDKDQVAVVDAKTMTVTAHYDLGTKDASPAGQALDAKNHILFVACRNPASMIVMNALTGKVITTLPIGTGVDGAAFNPNTMEAFSSQGDGTLTVIKENSPTDFAVEQTVQTQTGARTLTLDAKTGRVLVISAQYAPLPADAPPPAAGARGPRRGPMIPDSFTIVAVGK